MHSKQYLGYDLPEALSGEELERLTAQFVSTVGARIRELRKMQGLSTRAIWKRHRIRPSQFSRVESGKSNLTAWTAVRFAYVLGVRPWDFYVPREDAPSLKPKQHEHPLPPKAELEGATTAFRQQIGKRIRALRTLQGMSADELAEFSGIAPAMIVNLEAGRVNLRASTAIRIADAIGVLPHELFIPRELSGIRPRTTDAERSDDA